MKKLYKYFYKITEIVRVLSLVNSSVYMRIPEQGFNVALLQYSLRNFMYK